MDVNEIIHRLEKIAKHAVHCVGEPILVLSLDDGIALNEAAELLKEQEPKTGHWVDRMCRDFHCSECKDKLHNWIHADGYCYDDLPKFCPNCGAKMERGIMDRDGNITYPDYKKRR